MRRVVQITSELARVCSLPRRKWSDREAEECATHLTRWLKTPSGQMKLKPSQAVALFEIAKYRGAVCPLNVGDGKTLISFLAPTVLGASRPVLLVPGGLVRKTEKDQAYLSKHFSIPNYLRIMSYELLGRVKSAKELEIYRPDLVILDEAHKVRNRKASVTRRVNRYLEKAPGCAVVILTGTLYKSAFTDFDHMLKWALGPGRMPLPNRYTEVKDWSDATASTPTCGLGALREFGSDAQTVRQALGRRVAETPGVVYTRRAGLGVSLRGRVHTYEAPKVVQEATEEMLATWETPDGQPFWDAIVLYQHLQELALGYYNRWNPPPPKPWLDARVGWFKVCRDLVTNNRRELDSPLAVSNAIDAGHYPYAREPLHAWREIKDTFTPKGEGVWLDEFAIDACKDLVAHGDPAIVWIERYEFGEALAKALGLPLFGAKGLTRNGDWIENEKGDRHIVASRPANGTGTNLQMFHRHIITTTQSGGDLNEQLIGRMHRTGQQADTVYVEFLETSVVHSEARAKALLSAKAIEEFTGQQQKLNLIDWE